MDFVGDLVAEVHHQTVFDPDFPAGGLQPNDSAFDVHRPRGGLGACGRACRQPGRQQP
jgi:hypothetical protein